MGNRLELDSLKGGDEVWCVYLAGNAGGGRMKFWGKLGDKLSIW